MAEYEVTGQNGKTYRVTGDTPEGAAAAVAQMLSGEPPEQGKGWLYENLVGHGAVDTPGERLGKGINDFAKGFFPGVVSGATNLADLPRNMRAMGAGLGVNTYEALTGNEVGEDRRNAIEALARGQFNRGSLTDTADALTDGAVSAKPETRAGQYGKTVGEFVPGALAFGGPSALLKYAAVPGVASEFAGGRAEGKTIAGQDAEPLARLMASVAAPVGVNAANNAARRMITPLPADPVRTKAVQLLDDEGVHLTAGQKTGSKNLMYREDVMPRTQAIVEQQGDEFTAAALRRIGVESTRAEPQIMKAAAERIGGMFEELAARNAVNVDAALRKEARRITQTYSRLTNKSNTAPLIRSVQAEITRAAKTKTPITGAKYQTMRSDLGAATQSSDGALRSAAKGMIAALDDAMGRSISATGNADDIAAYATARQQWRDFLAIQRAASAAGEGTALGVVSPLQLRTAVAGQGRSSYAQGGRDLGELARAGTATMKPLPQSGTQPRFGAHALQALQGGGTGTGTGLLTYALTKDPNLAAAAGVGGAMLPAARNAAIASPAGQAYMANQLVKQGGPVIETGLLGVLTKNLAEKENRRRNGENQ